MPHPGPWSYRRATSQGKGPGDGGGAPVLPSSGHGVLVRGQGKAVGQQKQRGVMRPRATVPGPEAAKPRSRAQRESVPRSINSTDTL